ncbi:MAG: carboxylesterase/lipase family protein [Bacteroidota bacterium]
MKIFYRFSVITVLLISISFSSLLATPSDGITKTGPSKSLIVQTKMGKVRGTTEKQVSVWRGIRFAKAPVGNLRFRAPETPDAWVGVQDALEFGSSAPQTESSLSGDEPQSEDCLFLNIWSPAADDKKRPVMFWIHGGGFEIGTGSSSLYNGANLANNGDVVVVTTNYRLGTLGFLYFDNTKDLKGEFENNLGIRDQIAALNWVKENIAAFGGDPERVTIFGESAGGTSVQTLLATPSAKGLFKGVIAESGPAAILWQPETAKSITKEYLEILDIPEDSLHLLKKIPLETLKGAQLKLRDFLTDKTVQKVFSPTIDGSLLTTDISACLNSAQSGNIALMLGTNKDESTMFASKKLKMVPTSSEGLEKEFLYVLSPEDKKRVTSAYSAYPNKRGILDLVTDAVFRIPAIRVAECQSKVAPVYMYRFDWSSFALNLTGLRSFHGLEIPFVFGNSDGRIGRLLKIIASKRLIKSLSGSMQQAWVNFARYGNPNGEEAGAWKAFDTNERATMIFNKRSKLVLDPDHLQRRAWEGVRYY